METHMATSSMVLATNYSIQKWPISVPQRFTQSTTTARLSTAFKPILRALPQIPLQIDTSKTITDITTKFLDAVVDTVFEFVEKPLLPSQSNLTPVEELGEAVPIINNIQGEIPQDFPEGVYIRNGLA
ncbi:hypothetical protein RIF29_12149 [Crotalaria pallida]|uniref:Uncharacterized protein n=1 Tax=Crotalaria pallida TaxID=3830 RepID=A0AAN9IN51_CROPI